MNMMRNAIRECFPHNLNELKYRVLFPGHDPFTHAILDSMPRTWIGVLDWMTMPDEVTDALYPVATPEETKHDHHPERVGKTVKFPRDANSILQTLPYIGHIGDLDDYHHLETLSEHTSVVCANLICNSIFQISPENMITMLGLIGLLHDIGKKYTATTNSRNKLRFSGHAELSAYIAGLWIFHNPAFSLEYPEEIWVTLAAIYCHTEFKMAKTAPAKVKIRHKLEQFFRRDYLVDPTSTQEYVSWTIAILNILKESDISYENPDEYAIAQRFNLFQCNRDVILNIIRR